MTAKVCSVIGTPEPVGMPGRIAHTAMKAANVETRAMSVVMLLRASAGAGSASAVSFVMSVMGNLCPVRGRDPSQASFGRRAGFQQGSTWSVVAADVVRRQFETLAGRRLGGVCARGQDPCGLLGGNHQVITAQAVELRIGARVLLEESSFRIAAGDRIGLVGRNGAGKTTLTKTLAGETQPTGGQIVRSGEVGYLPQDPASGDLGQLAMDRVLSARGLDEIVSALRKAESAMASEDDAVRDAAMD